MTPQLLERLTLLWIGLGLALLPFQLLVAAPYGRHERRSWGAELNNRLGWFVMEAVSPSALVLSYLLAGGRASLALLPMALWLGHYVNRGFIFPWQIRTRGKRMPVLIMVFAVFFNSMNGFLNGWFFGAFAAYQAWDFVSWHALAGLALFALGMGINIRADQYLISLRRGDDRSYYIPGHPLFKRISCPNHAGEILEWAGFALVAWSLPALAFFAWTLSNLLPRAIHHHRWYRRTFEAYPKDRKALIPFVL